MEDSDELESAYRKVASQGSSAAPDDPEAEVDYHYVCLVRSDKNGRLYELDGDRSGPIDRGAVLGPEEDVLAPGGLNVVREYVQSLQGHFNLMALVLRE